MRLNTNIIEANKEVARHNRQNRALSLLLTQLNNEDIAIEEKQIKFIVEVVPPKYNEDAIQMLAINGLRVISTNYSQHVFLLDTEMEDRL